MSGATGRPEAVGIVGAGILGLAIARRIQQVLPGVEVTVLDKEERVAQHQTGHNSGVVHAGLYYKPGSLKAELCRRGAVMLRDYCRDNGIPYDECGKLVVAANDAEVPALRDIQRRAEANQVPGLSWVDRTEIPQIEPYARGAAALHSPQTAITDYAAVSRNLAADIEAAGGRVLLGHAVTRVVQEPRAVVLGFEAQESRRFDYVVQCAGLQSDILAAWAGDSRDPVILPFRGEYLKLVPDRAEWIRGLIYPVPDPNYPFLGVHFTRRVDGTVDLGPNAVLATSREGYLGRNVSAKDMWGIASSPGFWRLAREHWRMGATEVAGSASTRVFMSRARIYVPEITAKDVVPAPAGVRAQAVDRSGALVDDFRIHELGRVTALRNAPSPAATSSLAIAEHVVEGLPFL